MNVQRRNYTILLRSFSQTPLRISFHSALEFASKVYTLAKPFGRSKLGLIIGFSFAQGLFQAIGVSSIFPFLALATDPERLRHSHAGKYFLKLLPEMGDRELLLASGVFAILMLAISNAVNLLSEFARTRYAHRFAHWLRTTLLAKITRKPFTEFLRENSSILIKKVVGDVTQFTTGVLLPLLDCLARIATIAILVTLLFYVQAEIAISACLVLGSFYLVVFQLFRKWRSKAIDGFKSANRGTFIEAQQLLSGIKPMKIHSAENFFLKRFKLHSKNLANLSAKLTLISNTPRYLVEPLAFSGIVATVLVFSARGQDLTALLPNLGVLALAGYRLLPAFQLLYGQVNQLATTEHALNEIFDEFLAAEEDFSETHIEITDPNRTIEPFEWSSSITLRDISFCYPGATKPILEDFNLNVPKNTSIGIVGESGAGKSTLIDLLIGLHNPTKGEILVDNKPISAQERRAWRACIGYVPQDIFLIDDTISANVAFGVDPKNIDIDSLRHAAKAAQILDYIEVLPNGWNSTVGERGVQLSGGQRQRIGLARALYHKPSLLVLDEATSALDQATERRVIDSIDNMADSMTIVIIAHRLTAIEGCDHRIDLSQSQEPLTS